jgi:hypothetical protein
MNILFSAKKFPEKRWPKIYLGQDPDPDVLKKSDTVYSDAVKSDAGTITML